VLYLDFVGCTMITVAGLQAVSNSLPAELEVLELHFAGCERLHAGGIRNMAQKLPSSLRIFKATFLGTLVDKNFANLDELRAFVNDL